MACCCYLGQFVLFPPLRHFVSAGRCKCRNAPFPLDLIFFFIIILCNGLHSWAKYGINCLWSHHTAAIFCVFILPFCCMKYYLFSWFGHHSVMCLPNYSSKFYSCGSSLNFLGVRFPAMILHCLSDIDWCFSHFFCSEVDKIIPLTEWFTVWESIGIFQMLGDQPMANCVSLQIPGEQYCGGVFLNPTWVCGLLLWLISSWNSRQSLHCIPRHSFGSSSLDQGTWAVHLCVRWCCLAVSDQLSFSGCSQGSSLFTGGCWSGEQPFWMAPASDSCHDLDDL